MQCSALGGALDCFPALREEEEEALPQSSVSAPWILDLAYLSHGHVQSSTLPLLQPSRLCCSSRHGCPGLWMCISRFREGVKAFFAGGEIGALGKGLLGFRFGGLAQSFVGVV